MSASQPTVAPYGSWLSPITAALLVENAVGLASLTVYGDRIHWIEPRPAESGRQVLVSAATTGPFEPQEVLPAEFSVRTQVHEYGGRCYAITGDRVLFSNWADQRLWVQGPGGPPEPLTVESEPPRSVRFADPVIAPDGGRAVCVRETHGSDNTVTNDLVMVTLDAAPAAPVLLAGGHDFYAAPRISPDGSRLAWVSWDLPDMPWESSQLWVADIDGEFGLGEAALVAGGPGESVTQPRWSPTGVLHYLSDRTGWWNLYNETGAALCPMAAEFGGPDWTFGNASYGFNTDGALVATWADGAGEQLGLVSEGKATAADLPFSTYSYLTPAGEGTVFAVAASPTLPPALVRIPISGGEVQVVRASRHITVAETHLSRPEHVTFPTAGGATAHALFYAPAHATCQGPVGERPPVLVIIHGGPTSATTSSLNLAVQYWTNRGFAVADVNYRGSSGYGRPYRQALDGQWGIADVEDCAAVVRWLDSQGLVDGSRAVIRGGSAGGFTTLAALAFTDVFAAGASHFGVADLELLARDTHKFESRYLDGLVGRWPEEAEVYQARSPIHHVDQIASPLILFQGLEDMIVPPAQAELMYGALKDRGIPVAYLAFAGEQHGFRKADTVKTVMATELAFYGRVLGFEPAGDPVDIEIANAEKLSLRS